MLKDFVIVLSQEFQGNNDHSSDLFELRRYCIGLYHSLGAFKSEISGIRQIALHLLGRRK